jgi:hypothetical protein
MKGRVLPDNIYYRHLCPASVVQIGNAVCKTWAEMKKSARRLADHACIAVRGSGDNAFEKSEDAAHLREPVQGGDDVHFRSARICETDFYPAGDQRANETFSSVHLFPALGDLPCEVQPPDADTIDGRSDRWPLKQASGRLPNMSFVRKNREAMKGVSFSRCRPLMKLASCTSTFRQVEPEFREPSHKECAISCRREPVARLMARNCQPSSRVETHSGWDVSRKWRDSTAARGSKCVLMISR